MGKRWEQHSDLCGCERCARKADLGDNSPTFDMIVDADYLDCGCRIGQCECDAWDDGPYSDEDDLEAEAEREGVAA